MEDGLIRLTDLSFPLSVIEHQKSCCGQIFSAHCHETQLQIFVIRKGEASIYCDGQVYNISAPDILLVNCGELHYGESFCSNLQYIVYRVDLSLLDSNGFTISNEKYIEPLLHREIRFFNKINDDGIRDILGIAFRVLETKKPGYELELISYTYALLSLLIGNHVHNCLSSTNAKLLNSRASRFSDVFRYIDEHYTQPISLEELSIIAQTSSSHFCRQFKACIGRSPIDYINYVRISHAVFFLNQGCRSITEAAMSVGFCDSSYFCRVFKKYMGQSPMDYQRNDSMLRI